MHISIQYPHTLFRTVDHPAIPVHSSDEETDGCFRIVSCFTDLRGGADVQGKLRCKVTVGVDHEKECSGQPRGEADGCPGF